MSKLDRLAALAGIEPGFHDIWGGYHRPDDDLKRAILGAMGLPAASEADLDSGLWRLEEAPWQRALEPVQVVREDEAQPGALVTLAAQAGRVAWRLEEEDGRVQQGEASAWELPEIAVRDGKRRLRLALPWPLPLGYHRLRLSDHADALTLIVAPRRGHQIPAARLWGLAIQLYSVRSRRNWGIGDFADLEQAAGKAAGAGASAIGLNPLHALFLENPAHASPYSPSSRLFLNPLALALPEAPEEEPAEALRQPPLVDYPAVGAAKLRALRAQYEALATEPDSFRAFKQAGGAALWRHALFQCLCFHQQGKPWREWPEAYRSPQAPGIASFAAAQARELDFQQYLQYLCDAQLAKAAACCRESGMAIGLIRDLAVSSDPNGADCWSDPAVLVGEADIGCPPDDFNPAGQNWGAPPFNPVVLKERAFAPFIDLLRANMRHAGGLRIDHAMSLQHLFWCPKGAPPGTGAYVAYPFADLLGILALESRRQRCIIIGEDLGTVPAGFRETLGEAGVLSTRVMPFERTGDGRFKPPQDYPVQAMVTASTHDLPPIEGWWRGRDLALRRELGLGGDDEGARDRDRWLLREALAAAGVAWDPENEPLARALHRFLARTPSGLVMAQIDDVLGETEPVNLPGTTASYPNWRRKLSQEVEDWDLAALSQDLAERRG